MTDHATGSLPATPAREILQRRSKLAAGACRMLAVPIPVLLVVSWGLGDGSTAILTRFGLPADHEIGTLQAGLVMAVGLVPVLALVRALFAAARCFDGFAKGQWFGAGQPRALGTTGLWLVISGAAGLVTPTLLGLILSANAAPGARVFAVEISGTALTACLFGALIWTLGHVWAMALEIAAENEAFV
jgi:hypothetical protein